MENRIRRATSGRTVNTQPDEALRRVVADQAGQRLPADWYSTAARADHNAHCTPCRERTAASDAFGAANAASIGRRDRRQLGLNLPRTTAVNA